MKRPHRQNVIGWILFVVFLFVAAGFGFALTIIFSSIKVDLKADSYTLSFLTHKESATYADVEEILLLDSSYSAKKISSFGGMSKDFGTYKNAAYGKHFRLTYSENKHNYIMLKRKNGKITVFNLKHKGETEKVYQQLSERVAAAS